MSGSRCGRPVGDQYGVSNGCVSCIMYVRCATAGQVEVLAWERMQVSSRWNGTERFGELTGSRRGCDRLTKMGAVERDVNKDAKGELARVGTGQGRQTEKPTKARDDDTTSPAHARDSLARVQALYCAAGAFKHGTSESRSAPADKTVGPL